MTLMGWMSDMGERLACQQGIQIQGSFLPGLDTGSLWLNHLMGLGPKTLTSCLTCQQQWMSNNINNKSCYLLFLWLALTLFVMSGHICCVSWRYVWYMHVAFCLSKLVVTTDTDFNASTPSQFLIMQQDVFTSFITFGVEGDEAVAERPILYRLLQNHLFWKDVHVDVIKLAQALQDLSHGLGFWLFCHGTYTNQNLSLLWLVESWKSKAKHKRWMIIKRRPQIKMFSSMQLSHFLVPSCLHSTHCCIRRLFFHCKKYTFSVDCFQHWLTLL